MRIRIDPSSNCFSSSSSSSFFLSFPFFLFLSFPFFSVLSVLSFLSSSLHSLRYSVDNLITRKEGIDVTPLWPQVLVIRLGPGIRGACLGPAQSS